MAWTQSGFFLATIQAAMVGQVQTGTPTQINWLQSANQYISMVSGSATAYTTAPLQYGNAAPAWVNTSELLSSAGSWTVSGGVVLSTAFSGADVVPTSVVTGSGPYVLTYSWTHPVTVATTTFTSAWGCIIYFHDITAGLCSKPELLAINFGAGYNTVAGTFGITPSGSGLAAITLTQ